MSTLSEFKTGSINCQEDAQEYLSFLISKLDDELAIVNKQTNNIPQPVEGDPWMTKEKGKSCVNLTENLIEQTTNRSIISQIFQGQLQSVVSTTGSPNSASSEPFYSISLDILDNSISSLESALNYFTKKENVQYSNSQNKSVSATKQTKIEKGPPILIFHFKRFTASNQKIFKDISFPNELTLQSNWCTTNSDHRNKKYQLSSVVSHVGKETKGGHYICHSLNSQNTWLTFNDKTVTKTNLKSVLSTDNCYLLFYRKV